MFYLLEDNRIIETEKEYEVEYIKDPYFNSQNEYKFVYVKDLHYQGLQVLRNATTEENIGFIKKQSENVFDLIEKGDLITEKRIWCNEEVYVIANVWSKEDKLIHCFHSTLFDDDVYAIYKLNSHGDYIKVWEKKEE